MDFVDFILSATRRENQTNLFPVNTREKPGGKS